MRIFLIRHGEAEVKEKDSILTSKGIKQAKNIAKFLENTNLDLVFCSQLTRAKQTLEEYKKVNQKIKTEFTDELNEIYRVIVGGLPKEGTPIDREEKDKKRTDNFFNSLLKLDYNNIAIFGHGNLIRYYLSKVLKINPKELWQKMIITSGSISIIEIGKNKELQVKAINLYEHQKEFIDEFLNGEIKNENYLP